MPKTVAEMLVKRYEDIKNLKELFGEEYTDYNLVFASSCGRPIEGQVINRALSKLIKEHDLPPFEEQFYQPESATTAPEETKEPVPQASASDQETLMKLLANPEIAALLKTLAKNL